MGPFLLGFIALAVLGPVLKQAGTPAGASAYGRVANLPAAIASRFLDPTVPMFTKPTAPASTSSPSSTANPAALSSSANNLSKSSLIPQVPSPQEQP